MENTRRSFLKKMTAAGVGAAGLAMAGTASATTVAGSPEPQKKKQPEKMMANCVSDLSEQVHAAMSTSIMCWLSREIRLLLFAISSKARSTVH